MTATDITGLRRVHDVGRRPDRVRARPRSVPALARRGRGSPGRGRAGRSAVRAGALHEGLHRLAHGPRRPGDRRGWSGRRGRAPTRAHERERLHVRAVDAMRRGDHSRRVRRAGPDRRPASDRPDRRAHRRAELHHPGRLSRRHRHRRAGASRPSPDEPQYQTMLGFFLEQSGYNDEGLAMSLALARPGPDQPLHVPRGRPRLSGARRLPERARDVRARRVARSAIRTSSGTWPRRRRILGHERMTRDYWASTAPPLAAATSASSSCGASKCCAQRAGGRRRSGATSPSRASAFAEYADWQTTWMHHWLGVAFARAGDWTEAGQQLERLRRHARRARQRPLVDAGRRAPGSRAGDHPGRSRRRRRGSWRRRWTDLHTHGRRQPRAEGHLPRRVPGGASPSRPRRARSSSSRSSACSPIPTTCSRSRRSPGPTSGHGNAALHRQSLAGSSSCEPRRWAWRRTPRAGGGARESSRWPHERSRQDRSPISHRGRVRPADRGRRARCPPRAPWPSCSPTERTGATSPIRCPTDVLEIVLAAALSAPSKSDLQQVAVDRWCATAPSRPRSAAGFPTCRGSPRRRSSWCSAAITGACGAVSELRARPLPQRHARHVHERGRRRRPGAAGLHHRRRGARASAAARSAWCATTSRSSPTLLELPPGVFPVAGLTRRLSEPAGLDQHAAADRGHRAHRPLRRRATCPRSSRPTTAGARRATPRRGRASASSSASATPSPTAGRRTRRASTPCPSATTSGRSSGATASGWPTGGAAETAQTAERLLTRQ